MNDREISTLSNLINQRIDDLKENIHIQINDLKDEITELKTSERQHYSSCPYQENARNIKLRVDKIEDDLILYRALIKYRRIAFYSLIGIAAYYAYYLLTTVSIL